MRANPNPTTAMNIPADSLRDRVALVTGAGSGIGRASALVLASAGAAVGVLGRTENEVQSTADEIHQRGGCAVPLVADVTRQDQLQPAVERLLQAWGRLDIVHANAGINGLWASIEDLSEQAWDDTLDINLKGAFLTLKHTVPFLKTRGGSIIITSSVNGTRMFSNTGATAYACAKAAQVALGKMLALELSSARVRVNIICPGAIESNIHESTIKQDLGGGRLPVEFPRGAVPLTDGAPGAAEQVGQLVWFLASDASSHITGTEIYIDGAQSLLQG